MLVLQVRAQLLEFRDDGVHVVQGLQERFMGTLDVLQSGIHLLHEVADIGPDLMGVVHLDVVLDGSRIGHATGAAVVDREGRVTQLDLMPKRVLADRILDAVKALGVPATRRTRPQLSDTK